MGELATRTRIQIDSAVGRLPEVKAHGRIISDILAKRKIPPEDFFPFIQNLTQMRQRLVESGDPSIHSAKTIGGVGEEIRFRITRKGTKPVKASITFKPPNNVRVGQQCGEIYQVEKEGGHFTISYFVMKATNADNSQHTLEQVSFDVEPGVALKSVCQKVWDAHRLEIGHQLR